MELTFNVTPVEAATIMQILGSRMNDFTALMVSNADAEGEEIQEKKKRMRTADQAHRMLCADDPETNISLCFIKRIVKQELIPVTCVGRKRLIDYDQLLEYIANPPTEKEKEPKAEAPRTAPERPKEKRGKDYGKIRRID